MAGPPLTLRCPSCGQYVTAPPGPPLSSRYVSCPHCGSPIPVVPPRDPAPLFSWEVYPHLYPNLPFPRVPSPRVRQVTLAILFASAAVLLAASAVYLYGGATSLTPHDYLVAGEVRGPAGPVAGATIRVSGENQFFVVVHSGVSGNFSVANVPSGAVTLNVTAPTFSPTLYEMFVSPVYSAAGEAGPQALVIPLLYGDNSTQNLVSETAFSSLESLAASLWSATVLWIFTGLIVVFATWAFLRTSRSTRGVVAASTALASTAVPILLGVADVYPWTVYLVLGLGALAAAALTLVLVPMAATGRPPDYGAVG